MARLLVPLKDLNQELWARQMDQQEQEGSGNHMELLFCTKLTPVKLNKNNYMLELNALFCSLLRVKLGQNTFHMKYLILKNLCPSITFTDAYK